MLRIKITNKRQNQELEHAAGPLEFGRGLPRGSTPRFQVEDSFVSRDHLRVEELPGGRVRLANLSQRLPVLLADGSHLPVGGIQEFRLPLDVTVGETVLALGLVPGEEVPLDEIAAAPMASEDFAAEGFRSIAQPISRLRQPQTLAPANELAESPGVETLAQWMETVLALQRSAASPADLHGQTARAMVGMIGLDVGLVLLSRDNNWKVVARAARDEDDQAHRSRGREFSQTVLRQVVAERRTFYQDLGMMKSLESLKGVDAVVVSPIFGLQEDVVGVLYGLRRGRGGRLQDVKIRPLEAQLMQLLAAAISANLARATATRTRVQFEQFFSPELVRELERDPALLDGRGQDVTILMSDLRGFSSISEQLGPQETCRLVRDVMEQLSERIVEHGGAIVSYLGDGILAMWNAPLKQENHAILACRAALAMIRELPDLNETWQAVVGRPLAVGIGINTGPAMVGNTGSSRKFMYGPLGNTVNLASRVEGATKQFRLPVLITGSTRALVGDAFATRRLGKVRVVGIAEPVDLYELHGETAALPWTIRRDTYEAALAHYEALRWLKACQTLLPMLEPPEPNGHYDYPTLRLMNRCWKCLEAPPDPFEPVLELSGK